MDLSKIRIECCLWSIAYIIAGLVLPYVLEKKALVPVPTVLMILAQGIVVLGSVVALFYVRNHAEKSFNALLVTTLLIYFILPIYLPYCQRHCGYATCAYIKEKSCQPAKVFCVYNYFDDFPFYLNQTVGVVDFIPDEHTLGFQTEPCERYVSMSNFRECWTKKGTYYAAVARGNEGRFEQQMQGQSVYLLHQDAFFSLYSNVMAK